LIIRTNKTASNAQTNRMLIILIVAQAFRWSKLSKIMAWQVKFSRNAAKQFAQLDKPVKHRIINFLETRLATLANPKQIGKPLQGTLSEYWAYRVDSYRILAQHQGEELLILVVEIGHHGEIYK
jgi:mRNA interferase RelE/StbE